jgi:CRISPR system Cascade subunit CasE
MSQPYLTRIRLRPGASRHASFWRMVDQGDAHHRLVWGFFPKKEEGRDFLYRAEGQAEHLVFYTLSKRPPEDTSGLWIVDEPKPFLPRLSSGQILEFSLRANPVRRSLANPDEQVQARVARRSDKHRHSSDQKHDVVMLEKRRLTLAKEPVPQESELVQQEGERWLRQKEIGVRWCEVRADGYQQHRIWRRGGAATFSTIEFSGLLEVTDPARMIEQLWAGASPGLGSARGFGCGLMLVRRASSSWSERGLEDEDEDDEGDEDGDEGLDGEGDEG